MQADFPLAPALQLYFRGTNSVIDSFETQYSMIRRALERWGAEPFREFGLINEDAPDVAITIIKLRIDAGTPEWDDLANLAAFLA